jgi:TonB family protein
MKIKLNTYKILFRLLDLLSNNKLLHKTVINRKIYLGASIISLSMMNSGCTSDKTETKNSNDKKDSTIDNLNGNEIPKSKQDSILKTKIKAKSAGHEIIITADCYQVTEAPSSTLQDNIDIKQLDSSQIIDQQVEMVTCYSVVETMPEFPGGEEARINYFSKNLIWPKGVDSISGTVYIEFVVETTGEITNVNVKRGIHPLLDSEAVKVVKNMPKWITGTQNGVKVRTLFVIPIKFIYD